MEDKLRGVKQKVADGFDLPKEVVTDVPKISVIGNNEVTIENHKGILSFDNDKMKVKTRLGNLVIEGKGIEILFIGGSTITISGLFKSLRYEGEK